jgi:hypothetical protein
MIANRRQRIERDIKGAHGKSASNINGVNAARAISFRFPPNS